MIPAEFLKTTGGFLLIIGLLMMNGVAADGGIGAEAMGDLNFWVQPDNYTYILTNGPVTANFTAVPDLSKPYIADNFSWTIDNTTGNTYTIYDTTPLNWLNYVISTPGIFFVNVTAYNGTNQAQTTMYNSTTVTAVLPIVGSNVTQAPSYNYEANFTFNVGSNSSMPDGYSWKFGSESSNVTSTTNYVNHTFPIATCGYDNYTVVVTAYNTTNSVLFPNSTLTTTAMINSTPRASFNIYQNGTVAPAIVKGPVPLLVDLISTTANCTTSPVSGVWNFSDGSASNSTYPNVTKLFSNPGFYNITLNVSSQHGWNLTNRTLIAYENISANFTTPAITCPVFPLNVTFRDNSSGSTINEWSWDFGDGSTVRNITTNSTDHTYYAPGVYSVGMTGWNSTYDILNSSTQQVAIAGLYADFTINPSAPYLYRDRTTATVSFNSTSNGTPTHYEWYFGPASNVTPNQGILKNETAVYTQAGIYNVTLTVRNETCHTSNTSIKQFQVFEYLESQFSYSPKYGTYPLNVQFTDLSTDYPVQWQWTFYAKNGTPINTVLSQNPVQQYPESGTYRVDLITVNQSGVGTTYTENINLYDGINANFSANMTRGVYPFTVNFTDLSTPSGFVTNYSWNFGDPYSPANSTMSHPEHTYTKAGNYTVTLTAWNSSTGAIDTEQKSDYIEVVDPIQADFMPNGTYAVDSLRVVSFTDLSTPSGRVTGWSWDFGDGTVNTTQNPVHQFGEFKSYNVTLIASDSVYNSSSTVVKELNLTENRTPTADFVYSPGVVDIAEPVNFTSTSQGPAISRLLWDFGDGNTHDGLDHDVSHAYNEPGWYDVSLTAENQYGSNTKTILDAVKVRGLIPFFTMNPDGWSNIGTTVTFTDASKGEPTQWAWDFGDGSLPTNTTSSSITHVFNRTGIYSVLMTATNWELETKSVARSYQVVEKSAPRDVDFGPMEGTQFTGPAPLTVYFEDNTPSQSNITSRYWEFGDGSNLIEEIPFPAYTIHEYSNPGMYTVTLTVKNENGVNEKTKVVYVVVL